MSADHIQKEIESVLANSDLNAAVDAAVEREQEACQLVVAERFNEAFVLCDVASGVYESLANRQPANTPPAIAFTLSWAKVRILRGSAARRAGDLGGAQDIYLHAEGKLKEISEAVFSLPEEHQELTFDWATTTGSLLMNHGTLYFDAEQYAEALSTWSQAEELLFELYLRTVGPEADVECTTHVILLWDNIFTAAMGMDDVERAADCVTNAFKLFLWWPAQEKEHPDEVADAYGALLGSIQSLEPAARARFEDALPPPVYAMINDLLAE